MVTDSNYESLTVKGKYATIIRLWETLFTKRSTRTMFEG